MNRESLKQITSSLAKTVVGEAIIFPSQLRTDLLFNMLDPYKLSLGLKVGLSFGLLALAIKSTTAALEFSHHAEKHEKYLAWAGVAVQAIASLAIIVDTWK